MLTLAGGPEVCLHVPESRELASDWHEASPLWQILHECVPRRPELSY